MLFCTFSVSSEFILHNGIFFVADRCHSFYSFLVEMPLMEGIVSGLPKSTHKPVVDGIVTGIAKKKASLPPDLTKCTPSATRNGEGTFGAGRTPQGMGDGGNKHAGGMKIVGKH